MGGHQPACPSSTAITDTPAKNSVIYKNYLFRISLFSILPTSAINGNSIQIYCGLGNRGYPAACTQKSPAEAGLFLCFAAFTAAHLPAPPAEPAPLHPWRSEW